MQKHIIEINASWPNSFSDWHKLGFDPSPLENLTYWSHGKVGISRRRWISQTSGAKNTLHILEDSFQTKGEHPEDREGHLCLCQSNQFAYAYVRSAVCFIFHLAFARLWFGLCYVLCASLKVCIRVEVGFLAKIFAWGVWWKSKNFALYMWHDSESSFF